MPITHNPDNVMKYVSGSTKSRMAKAGIWHEILAFKKLEFYILLIYYAVLHSSNPHNKLPEFSCRINAKTMLP